MKFMVEFRLQAGSKNKVVDAFELIGPNRNPGVTFRSAWIGTHADVIFVLVESDSESLIAKAAGSWKQFGDFHVTPVIDAEQF